MIKGNKCEQKWHVWYERGVENKLRVTRLYEYYLLSTDLSRDMEPPKSVLLYFAYQCNLDWEYAAWLYSCVERCKTKDPELYITYKPELDHFLLDCLNKEESTGICPGCTGKICRRWRLTKRRGDDYFTARKH